MPASVPTLLNDGNNMLVVSESKSMDTLFNNPDEQAHVERLLRERLVQGFCLLERFCPACTTPLVKKTLLAVPPPPTTGVHQPDIVAFGSTDSMSSFGSSTSQPKKPSIVSGVAYCVKCEAHVVSEAAEIDLLDQQHHSRRKKGSILVTTTTTSPTTATATDNEPSQPQLMEDQQQPQQQEPGNAEGLTTSPSPKVVVKGMDAALIDDSTTVATNHTAELVMMRSRGEITAVVLGGEVTSYKPPANVPTTGTTSLDTNPSHPVEEFEVMLSGTATTTTTTREQATATSQPTTTTISGPREELEVMYSGTKGTTTAETSSSTNGVVVVGSNDVLVKNRTMPELWELQQAQQVQKLWHLRHYHRHQYEQQQLLLQQQLHQRQQLNHINNYPSNILPSQSKGIVVPGSSPTGRPMSQPSGLPTVAAVANDAGTNNKNVDEIHVIDCENEEEVSLLDANTMEENIQTGAVVGSTPPLRPPSRAGGSVKTTSSHETAVDMAIQRTLSIAKSSTSASSVRQGSVHSVADDKSVVSVDFPMPEFKVRRELAIKVLAAKMVQGYAILEGAQCRACRMPLMSNSVGALGQPAECFVCRVLRKRHLKATGQLSNGQPTAVQGFSSMGSTPTAAAVPGTVCVFGKDVSLTAAPPRNLIPTETGRVPMKPTTQGIDVMVVEPLSYMNMPNIVAGRNLVNNQVVNHQDITSTVQRQIPLEPPLTTMQHIGDAVSNIEVESTQDVSRTSNDAPVPAPPRSPEIRAPSETQLVEPESSGQELPPGPQPVQTTTEEVATTSGSLEIVCKASMSPHDGQPEAQKANPEERRPTPLPSERQGDVVTGPAATSSREVSKTVEDRGKPTDPPAEVEKVVKDPSPTFHTARESNNFDSIEETTPVAAEPKDEADEQNVENPTDSKDECDGKSSYTDSFCETDPSVDHSGSEETMEPPHSEAKSKQSCNLTISSESGSVELTLFTLTDPPVPDVGELMTAIMDSATMDSKAEPLSHHIKENGSERIEIPKKTSLGATPIEPDAMACSKPKLASLSPIDERIIPGTRNSPIDLVEEVGDDTAAGSFEPLELPSVREPEELFETRNTVKMPSPFSGFHSVLAQWESLNTVDERPNYVHESGPVTQQNRIPSKESINETTGGHSSSPEVSDVSESSDASSRVPNIGHEASNPQQHNEESGDPSGRTVAKSSSNDVLRSEGRSVYSFPAENRPLEIAPTASELFQERWAILRADARSVLTRRMLAGWEVLSQQCQGKECNNFPLIFKGGAKRCVVCGGSGSGKDAVYRYAFSSHVTLLDSSIDDEISPSGRYSSIRREDNVSHSAQPTSVLVSSSKSQTVDSQIIPDEVSRIEHPISVPNPTASSVDNGSRRSESELPEEKLYTFPDVAQPQLSQTRQKRLTELQTSDMEATEEQGSQDHQRLRTSPRFKVAPPPNDVHTSPRRESVPLGNEYSTSTSPKRSMSIASSPKRTTSVVNVVDDATRESARKVIGSRLMEGWTLLDKTCPHCVMPLMVPIQTINEVCVLCGIADRTPAAIHPRTATMKDNESRLRSRIRTASTLSSKSPDKQLRNRQNVMKLYREDAVLSTVAPSHRTSAILAGEKKGTNKRAMSSSNSDYGDIFVARQTSTRVRGSPQSRDVESTLPGNEPTQAEQSTPLLHSSLGGSSHSRATRDTSKQDKFSDWVTTIEREVYRPPMVDLRSLLTGGRSLVGKEKSSAEHFPVHEQRAQNPEHKSKPQNSLKSTSSQTSKSVAFAPTISLSAEEEFIPGPDTKRRSRRGKVLKGTEGLSGGSPKHDTAMQNSGTKAKTVRDMALTELNGQRQPLEDAAKHSQQNGETAGTNEKGVEDTNEKEAVYSPASMDVRGDIEAIIEENDPAAVNIEAEDADPTPPSEEADLKEMEQTTDSKQQNTIGDSMAEVWPWIYALKSKLTNSSQRSDPPASKDFSPHGLLPVPKRPEPPESSPLRRDRSPDKVINLVSPPSPPVQRKSPLNRHPAIKIYCPLEPPTPQNAKETSELFVTHVIESPNNENEVGVLRDGRPEQEYDSGREKLQPDTPNSTSGNAPIRGPIDAGEYHLGRHEREYSSSREMSKLDIAKAASANTPARRSIDAGASEFLQPNLIIDTTLVEDLESPTDERDNPQSNLVIDTTVEDQVVEMVSPQSNVIIDTTGEGLGRRIGSPGMSVAKLPFPLSSPSSCAASNANDVHRTTGHHRTMPTRTFIAARRSPDSSSKCDESQQSEPQPMILQGDRYRAPSPGHSAAPIPVTCSSTSSVYTSASSSAHNKSSTPIVRPKVTPETANRKRIHTSKPSIPEYLPGNPTRGRHPTKRMASSSVGLAYRKSSRYTKRLSDEFETMSESRRFGLKTPTSSTRKPKQQQLYHQETHSPVIDVEKFRRSTSRHWREGRDEVIVVDNKAYDDDDNHRQPHNDTLEGLLIRIEKTKSQLTNDLADGDNDGHDSQSRLRGLIDNLARAAEQMQQIDQS